MSEPDDEWQDEDDGEDADERSCIQCGGYFWPDELCWLICQECRWGEGRGE